MAREEHAELIRQGIVHRGPFRGQKIADLSADQLRSITEKFGERKRGRQGTRAALLAAIAEEQGRRERGESFEPERPAVPKPSNPFVTPVRTQIAQERGGWSYRSRNKTLRRMGFANYRAYLDSDLWAEIRERIFKIKGRACYLCGRRANQVHHVRYHRNDLNGKRTRYLHPVCPKCHLDIERRDGKKASVIVAKVRFNTARKARKARLAARKAERQAATG